MREAVAGRGVDGGGVWEGIGDVIGVDLEHTRQHCQRLHVVHCSVVFKPVRHTIGSSGVFGGGGIKYPRMFYPPTPSTWWVCTSYNRIKWCVWGGGNKIS